MNFSLLLRCAELFSTHQTIHHLKRIGDTQFKLECDSSTYYIDLTRSHSTIFVAPPLLGVKEYQAPFDLSLQRHTSRATILGVRVLGYDRILQFELLQRGAYKSTQFFLQWEFTGRNTNVILLTHEGVVIDALRHVSSERSFRSVKIGQHLEPLPSLAHPPRERLLDESLSTHSLLAQEYEKRLTHDLVEKKKSAMSALAKKREKLEESLEKLPSEVALSNEAQLLREHGSLLLANLYKLGTFLPEVSLEDSTGGIRTLTLPEDSRSFSEAARIFFESAKKIEQKVKNLHLERENLTEKIAFYGRQMVLIEEAKSLEDVAILAPTKHQNVKKGRKKEEFESFFIGGVKVSFGKNQKENAKLLQEAKADDLWMHVRDIPSSHMILRGQKGKIHASIISKAAEILVGFLAPLGGAYAVDYTKRKFVKVIQGAQVIYAKHETVHVKKE